MSRAVGSVAWTSEELATLNKIMDEHPSNVSSGDWQPLVTEFFMRSPAYSARTKKAIREKFRVTKLAREARSQAEQFDRMKEEQSKGEVDRALRLDKAVAQLHQDLMRETARLITNYNKFVDTAILLASEVYTDTSGSEALRINMKELNRALKALEPELYQMRIDEIKGR